VIDIRTLQLQPFSMVSGDPPKTEAIRMNPPDQYAVQVQLRNTSDSRTMSPAGGAALSATLGLGLCAQLAGQLARLGAGAVGPGSREVGRWSAR
jgi:hypothetical protein